MAEVEANSSGPRDTTMNRPRFDRVPLTLWHVALACLLASILPPVAAQAPLPDAIPPTVTQADGDTGGTFFGHPPDPARTRHYYIAAEPGMWDYLPLGRDVVCGLPVPAPLLGERRVAKIRYVEYLDPQFQTAAITTTRLGIMGPVLRGQVGEYIAVTFYNRTSRPLSMHPHGVKYDKDSEGAWYEPAPGRGAAVGPGARFTYVWHLDEASGPAPDEPSSKGWLYHSHVVPDEEINLGLSGGIVVTDPARAREDGTPTDVDREMAALFMIFDESGLGEAEREAAEYASLPGGGPPAKTWTEVQQMLEAGARVSINGYVFGNLPGLEMSEGERVRWYLFGLGSIEDFHTAHWHGVKVVEEGRRRTDVVELLPATMKVADMVADNPGTWLFHCHVDEHMREGMFANMTIHPAASFWKQRTSAPAFLGRETDKHSMRVAQADAVVGAAPGSHRIGGLRLRGEATVYQAFSVFTQPIGVRIGNRPATFKPDTKGVAASPEGTLRILNASEFGVVYGGLLKFEFDLHGEAWGEALGPTGLADPEAEAVFAPVDVEVQIGQAHHKDRVAFRLVRE